MFEVITKTFNDNEISIIKWNETYWFPGKDLLRAFGYHIPSYHIRQYISTENKVYKYKLGDLEKPVNWDKPLWKGNTIFINIDGLIEIRKINNKKNKKLQKFIQWFTEDFDNTD